MGYRWADVLTGLVGGQDLDADVTSWVMGEILAGNLTPVQIAAFVVALRAKGETVAEISGMAEAMLARATPVSLDPVAVDVVGSGGDRANTVNISTMAAIVAAASGARVVKHGNRAASSACGTADCLEALGVALDVPPQRQARVLDECGIAFLFAPLYHQSLKHAASARRELGIQTTFNFLGPLANPARPRAQAVGIAHPAMAALVAGVLAQRGSQGLVFHGDDGLDELTTTTTSDVWLIGDGEVAPATLDPERVGLPRAHKEDLVGGAPGHNARVVHEVLGGQIGPVRDIVLLNAAAALLAFHKPRREVPVEEQLQPWLEVAAASVDEGRATTLLDRWVAASQAAAGH